MSDDTLASAAQTAATLYNAEQTRQVKERLEVVANELALQRQVVEVTKIAADVAFHAHRWVEQNLNDPARTKEFLLYQAQPYRDRLASVSDRDIADAEGKDRYWRARDRLDALARQCRAEDVNAVRWVCQQAVGEYQQQLATAAFYRRCASVPLSAVEPAATGTFTNWVTFGLVPAGVIALLALKWRAEEQGVDDRYVRVFGALVVAGLVGLFIAWVFSDHARKQWQAQLNKISEAPTRDLLGSGGTANLTAAHEGDAAAYEKHANQIARRFNDVSAAFIGKDWSLATVPVGPSTSAEVGSLIAAQQGQRQRRRRSAIAGMIYGAITLIVGIVWAGWVRQLEQPIKEAREVAARTQRETLQRKAEEAAQDRAQRRSEDVARRERRKEESAAHKAEHQRQEEERRAAQEARKSFEAYSATVAEAAEAYLLASMAVRIGDDRKPPPEQVEQWLTGLRDELQSAGVAEYCGTNDFTGWVTDKAGMDRKLRPTSDLRRVLEGHAQRTRAAATAVMWRAQLQLGQPLTFPSACGGADIQAAFTRFWTESSRKAAAASLREQETRTFASLKAQIIEEIARQSVRRPRPLDSEIKTLVVNELRRSGRVMKYERAHPEFDLPALVATELEYKGGR